MIGIDINDDGIGEPVESYNKPDVGNTYAIKVPATSDEFTTDKLGLQWQWHANPQPEWINFVKEKGYLRLNAVALPENFTNLWQVPNLLLQKLPAPEFHITSKLLLNNMLEEEKRVTHQENQH